MVWYSHLFKNFPEFVVIHSVKGFSVVVSETNVDIFLKFSCFLHDLVNVGNLISCCSACSKPSFDTHFVYLEILGSHTRT